MALSLVLQLSLSIWGFLIACTISQLIGLFLSAAVTLISLLSDNGGLAALLINRSFLSPSDPFSVLNESLRFNWSWAWSISHAWGKGLHRSESTSSKVIEATAEEVIHASTKATEGSKAAAESSAEASTKSSESVIKELISLLSSTFAFMTVALIRLATKATKSTSHESIIVVKEVGERVSSAEEVSEYIFCMLECEMIVEAAISIERPSSGSGPASHP